MTTNALNASQRFESLDALVQQSTSTDEDPSISQIAYVLEAIETSDVLRNRPVVVLCPNCGEEVDSFPDGLPAYVCHFNAACTTCGIESLPRWSVVVVDACYADVLPTDLLVHMVQRYWERHLWRGIQTAEDCPRTREFSKLYDEYAEAWDWEWRVHCPLCRRTCQEIGTQKLDYHHWMKDPDTGILLCRLCHDAIGGGQTDMDLDWQARELNLRSKHDLQVARLAAREALVCEYSSLADLASRVVKRYNLVQSATEVRCILDQTLNESSVRPAIMDKDLIAGLADL